MVTGLAAAAAREAGEEVGGAQRHPEHCRPAGFPCQACRRRAQSSRRCRGATFEEERGKAHMHVIATRPTPIYIYLRMVLILILILILKNKCIKNKKKIHNLLLTTHTVRPSTVYRTVKVCVFLHARRTTAKVSRRFFNHASPTNLFLQYVPYTQ